MAQGPQFGVWGSSGPYRVLSEPYEIRFLGFRGTTYDLQQHGWEFSAEQDPRRGHARLMMKHDQANLYGISEALEYDFFRHHMDRYRQGMQLPIFVVHAMRPAAHYYVQHLHIDLESFSPVDMQPQTVKLETLETLEEQLALFAKPLVRTQEIIVEPKDVAEALEWVKKLQAPEMAELQDRERKRQGREDLRKPRQIFHAQLISLAA